MVLVIVLPGGSRGNTYDFVAVLTQSEKDSIANAEVKPKC